MFILFSHFSHAQKGFFLEISEDCCGYALDVFEDEKGCIIANYDYGLTKVNPTGNILWSTPDIGIFKGTILEDSQSCFFVKVVTEVGGYGVTSMDYRGKKLWQFNEDVNKTLLRTAYDFINDSVRKQFVLAGDKRGIGEMENIYYWIAGFDYNGKLQWENSWKDTGGTRFFKRILKNNLANGYLLIWENQKYVNDEHLIIVDSLGKLLMTKPLIKFPCQSHRRYNYTFNDIIIIDSGRYLMNITAGPWCPDSETGTYFILFDSTGEEIKRTKTTWESKNIGLSNDQGYFLSYYNHIVKLNKNFKFEWMSEIFPITSIEHSKIKVTRQGRDGGYYGIAYGYRKVENEWPIVEKSIIYVFKTDSLGHIDPKKASFEKLQPFMLQPNPASGKVRLAIPYYYGHITAEFYDIHGMLLHSETRNELEEFDISSLSAGMYIVKAQLLETGERRTMKLVVQ